MLTFLKFRYQYLSPILFYKYSMDIYGILFSYTGCVGYESIDERMVLVIPKGAVAKDPRPAPGSVLPKDATDLKVKIFHRI